MMTKINIKKIQYILQRDVLTVNNIVIMVALLIALGWAMGSINVLERNYAQQQAVSTKEQELKLAKLELATLEYQRNYYKSNEYKELAVRQRTGKVMPGEKVFILPKNTELADRIDGLGVKTRMQVAQPSNTEQWFNFFFGDKSSLQ